MPEPLPPNGPKTFVAREGAGAPAVRTGEPADDELLRAIAKGDAAAFDLLFARHSGQIYSYLSRLVASRLDPDDLLQETFLRVLTHAKDYHYGASIRPWLFTIARNIALNALQRSKNRSDLEVQTDLTDWQPPAGSRSPGDPSQSAELKEEKARVLLALTELPTMHREILVLIIFNGFSYEEAAAITGDSENTLRSRVFHGLKKLRELMKEQP
ncbi:MAG: RNA polymerase sigma factor [Planctomycetes bacterium]|nr:RNA polymerase sigma factor [Planctomycetota bacterium]